MIKKVLAGLAALGVVTSVYASCSTHSYVINGKMVVCTTCCNYGNCTTSCI